MLAQKLSGGRKPGSDIRKQERLAERRRRIRRIENLVLWSVVVALLAGLVWVLWLPAIRVSALSVSGEPSAIRTALIEDMVRQSMVGFHGFVLPRDSIFFVPEDRIRTIVLETYPDIAAVSVERARFDAVNIAISARVPAFRWCGVAIDIPTPCYLADAEGFIFMEAASSTDSLLEFYAPLAEDDTASTTIRSYMQNASVSTPGIFRFVRTLADMGLIAERISIRGDEADIYIRDTDTRITYVIGEEVEAAALVSITLPTLPAAVGMLDYIDVRFPGKAYFKKKE